MGRCILMLDGKFIHWSSVTDAPESPLLPENLFKEYWYAEYGRSGWVDYANMIADTKKYGCSHRNSTVDKIISDNRAGDKDKKLTKKQIIEAYTCDTSKEFLEWSRQRDEAFQKMVADYGPREIEKRWENQKTT